MPQRFRFWGLAGLIVVMMMRVVGVTAVAPTNTPDQTANASYVEQVVELVNQERWNSGQLPPLKAVSLLHDSAQTHSNNMASRDFFAHCDLDTGDSPWARMIAAGYNYNWAGENIAAGRSTPASVMTGWMDSPGHKANILSTNYREIGVGYAYQSSDQSSVRADEDGNCIADRFGLGPFYHYWTQNFGTRSNVYPVVINREAYETTTEQVSLYMYGAGWATDMRFRNENGDWSSWQAYASDVNWTLSSGNGSKTVYAEIRSSTGEVRSANDTIILNSPIVQPIIGVSPAVITTLRQSGSTDLEHVTLTISNGGTETLNWTIAEQPAINWLAVSPTSGSIGGGQSSTTAVTIDPQGLTAGQYTTQLQISGNATNSPQTVDVTLVITDQIYETYLPLVVRD